MARHLLVELDGLQVSAAWSPPIDGVDKFVDVAIAADAFPFSGTVETIFTRDDLIQFSDALRTLNVPGKAVIGGGRTTLLALEVTQEIGPGPTRLAVGVTLIPSEDDGGSPRLSFAIFGVDPGFAARSADSISEFLRRRDRA